MPPARRAPAASCNAAVLAVAGGDEVPAAVAAAADVVLPDAQAVADLLAALV